VYLIVGVNTNKTLFLRQRDSTVDHNWASLHTATGTVNHLWLPLQRPKFQPALSEVMKNTV
jgi:hypothetical protein